MSWDACETVDSLIAMPMPARAAFENVLQSKVQVRIGDAHYVSLTIDSKAIIVAARARRCREPEGNDEDGQAVVHGQHAKGAERA